MAQNNLDGIKKLNKEDLEKSRKIILDYIGEQDKRKSAQAESVFVEKPIKIVDGLLKKKPIVTPVIKPEPKPEEIKRPDSLPVIEKEKSVVKKELDKIEEIVKPLPKIKIEAKKEKILKHSDEKEAEKINKVRKKIEEAKVRVERKKKRINNQRRKTEKSKNILKTKAKKKNFLYKDIKFFNVAFKYLFFIPIIVACLTIIFYLIFSWLLLRGNIDNSFTRFIANSLPVPAVITEDGYLEYYYYKDLSDQYNGDEKKLAVTRKMILLGLMDKFNISGNMSNNEVLLSINQRLINDREKNPEQLNLEDFLNKKMNSYKIIFLTD